MDDQPLHTGEVYHLWNFLYQAKADNVTMQILINHTEDSDLKSLMEDLLENGFSEEEQQIETILKETGIRLPPAPPDRPNVEVQDIPAGARFLDAEIAVLTNKMLMNGRMVCSYMTSLLNQAEIRTLFEDFQTIKSEFEEKLLTLLKEKGWYVSPPINIK